MDINTLKQIVKVAKDEGVAELKIDSKDFKVEVRFSTGHVVASQPHQHVVHPTSTQAPAPAAAAVSAPVAAVAKDNFHTVKSPFVGTFYASSGPGKPAYTKVGDKVKAGQALCVLEAMKIMNEIDADIDGTVVEICVENESLVEFGQPLFKIKPN
ncbi:MAG: acetyl-CoA carboxylase biotin carboxyl carrier protein [Bdellovibrionales bacterium]|nr:acetyl-CoA carboxylase biotin carboxyl carrier protein [Bdellovibrionales bacterium]